MSPAQALLFVEVRTDLALVEELIKCVQLVLYRLQTQQSLRQFSSPLFVSEIMTCTDRSIEKPV